MMWNVFLCIPPLLFGQMSTMLSQADAIAQKYNAEVAKASPPSPLPQPFNALSRASTWFSIDLEEIHAPALDTLTDDLLWDQLYEIGVQGVYLKGLKQGGAFRTKIAVDPKWGDWENLAMLLEKKGIALIGDAVGVATGVGSDFDLALKNVGEYPGLYHLVEIEPRDWKLLPTPMKNQFANVPWLTLQELHKKGYVPEQFTPYIKESSWNTTAPICCADGTVRRWIYLKEQKDDPAINWLNPSFAGCRIATSDVLDSIYNLGDQILQIDSAISLSAKETLSLWIRKLGAFSVLKTHGGLCEWKQAPTDLIVDNLTPAALLHALIAKDPEVLKLLYRLLLEEKIDVKRLVHTLQPIDRYSCDWAEFLAEPKKQFQYYEEILTADALRQRLLKQDAAALQGPDPVSWPSVCLNQLKDNQSAMLKTHLLLALFYAMQPGTFSFSVSDLLGLVKPASVDLTSSSESAMYGSLPSQIQNSHSFAMQLRNILKVRNQSGIASAELIAVPNTQNPSLLVLVHKLKNNQMLQMLAINFGNSPAMQSFEIPAIRQTSAIDLLSGLSLKKPLDSSCFCLEVPPLSGKVILFQTKYFP